MIELHWLTQIFILLVSGFIIWLPGNLFCKWVVGVSHIQKTIKKEDNEEDLLKAGRMIGGLERLLIVIGILLGRWEILAGVLALKTVARYQELDKQINTEYFLLGSLASLLWAILIAVILITLKGQYDFSILSFE